MPREVVLSPKIAERLIETGNIPDRNGFTRAGRALQKHSSREGSVHTKPTTGLKPADYNTKGVQDIRRIINDKTATIKYNDKYMQFDIKINDGAGARFDKTGQFITFLEP